MPIRVEHGPNLAPVGQLAYRTGQLEYRNKRRTELERLAMQQAEMRQRAQQQQNQIAASLQGQKMSHMNAMQRLAVGQQFGQINAEQANQWKVQADVKAQENRMIWGKQLGQNQFDLANLNAGLADQKEIQRIQNNHRQKQAFQHLNPAGEGRWIELENQKTKERHNKKIDPAELPGVIQQLDAQQDALVDQAEMTWGNDTKPGFQSVHIKDEDGNPKVYKTVTVRNEDGSVVYGYTPATTQMVEGPDGNMTEVPHSAQQIHDNTTTVVTRNGRDYLAKLNSTNGIFEVDDNAKPIDTPEWLAQQAEIKRAEAEREARRKWYTEREKDRQDAIVKREAELGDPGLEADPVRWHETYAFPEYKEPRFDLTETNNPPVPQAQQNQVVPLDDAAQAVPLEQQPVAPPADAGDVNIGPPGGLPGLGGPNAFWPGGVNPAAPEDQFAQQQQQQQQDQQQQRDPTQAIGNQGNPWPTEQMANAPSGAWVIPGPGIPAMIKE